MSIKTWLMDFLGANINKGKIVDDVIENELQEIYYKELAIQTAITLISNAISKCEIKVYEKNKEVKNKLYYTLNVEANKNENSSQLWHKAIEKMIYRNYYVIDSCKKNYDLNKLEEVLFVNLKELIQNNMYDNPRNRERTEEILEVISFL